MARRVRGHPAGPPGTPMPRCRPSPGDKRASAACCPVSSGSPWGGCHGVGGCGPAQVGTCPQSTDGGATERPSGRAPAGHRGKPARRRLAMADSTLAVQGSRDQSRIDGFPVVRSASRGDQPQTRGHPGLQAGIRHWGRDQHRHLGRARVPGLSADRVATAARPLRVLAARPV